MKALSLSQPWCWAVLFGGKHVENRSWQPPITMIGQRFAIHAAKSWDNEYYRSPDGVMVRPFSYLEAVGLAPPPSYHMYPASALVGFATLDRIVTEPRTLAADQAKWFFGPFGWILTDVVAIPRPIPHKGKQGLWTVPETVEREMLHL